MNHDMDSFLRGYRVLDLTDEKGHLCGKRLGDLGADRWGGHRCNQ